MIEVNNYLHGLEIARAADGTFNAVMDQVLSRSKDGKLLGGFIFQYYTGASITASTAGFAPGWLTRELIQAAFGYVFTQLECKQVILQIRSGNSNSLVFASKLGFKEVTRLPKYFPHDDLVIMRMWREECRWLIGNPRVQ